MSHSSKRAMRALLRQHRTERPQAQRAAASSRIVSTLKGLIDAPGATNAAEAPIAAIAAFAPLPVEPGYGELLETLFELPITVYLPIVAPEGQLLWAPVAGWEELSSNNRMGIPEPTTEGISSTKLLERIDLMVAPTLGLHPCGVRLGQGGGFYDRVLEQAAGQDLPPRVVALAFADEVHADIPFEDFDRAVDGYITEDGLTWV